MDRRRQRHNAALNKVCTICGRGYTAKGIDPMYCGAACKLPDATVQKLIDPMYCGAACKQKAYRRAHKSEI